MKKYIYLENNKGRRRKRPEQESHGGSSGELLDVLLRIDALDLFCVFVETLELRFKGLSPRCDVLLEERFQSGDALIIEFSDAIDDLGHSLSIFSEDRPEFRFSFLEFQRSILQVLLRIQIPLDVTDPTQSQHEDRISKCNEAKRLAQMVEMSKRH